MIINKYSALGKCHRVVW